MKGSQKAFETKLGGKSPGIQNGLLDGGVATTFKQLSKCTNLSKYNAKKYKKVEKTKRRKASMPNFAPGRHVEMTKTGHPQNDSAN